MKSELGEVGGKTRLGTGDAEICRYREAQAAADGRAMHGRHDRLLVAEDAHRLDVEVVDRQVGSRVVLRAGFLFLPCRIGEIGAGAERLALRGKNRRADFDVAIEFLQCVRDLVDQVDVEEVQRRPLDFDHADVADLLDADVREFAHVWSPMSGPNGCHGESELPLPLWERVGVGGCPAKTADAATPSPDILRFARISTSPTRGEVIRAHPQRKPRPRAIMPRSTSVVPPWMVSFGATFIANGNTLSRIS